MAISEADVKILWAKAGGRCSHPECNIDLTPLLEESGNIILGEMAHIIAHHPDGPRGGAGDRENIDKYPNLILLCPTHHTMIDKGAQDFSPATLRRWKSLHEDRISQAMDVPPFDSAIGLYRYTCRLLDENRIVHQRYGPTSLAGRHDIFGEAADVWKFRKLSTIVPNNNRIVRAFVANQSMVPDKVWADFLKFQEHARGFEANCYRRLDGRLAPRFPKSFEMLLEEIVNVEPDEEYNKSDRAVRLFESRLRKHKSVASFAKPDQTYVVSLIDGREVRAFLAIEDDLIGILGYKDYLMDEEEKATLNPGLIIYTIGRAYVVEILEFIGLDVDVDCIVSLSAYSWYTEQAQEVANEFGVKLFTVNEFFKFLGER